MEIVRIAGKFRLQEKLPSGPSHEIYRARNILSGQTVILKFEPVEGNDHTLEHEVFVYKKLIRGTGIPLVHWFGTESGFDIMAMDCLGPSLEDLFVRSGFQFTIKAVLLLARQLLCRLQYIHSRHFLHRDLKPSNIVMGIGSHTNLVYLIDFGLAKQYRDPNTHAHIPYKEGRGFTGTTTFASVNSHQGSELGRRDDLESLAYILFYFLWGSLPWQGLRTEKAILKRKRTITTHKLFLGLPVEFQSLFEHCRSLPFDDKPNYDHFYNLFGSLLLQKGFQLDTAFDWDDAGSKSQQDCTEKTRVLQDKYSRSPSKRRSQRLYQKSHSPAATGSGLKSRQH